MKVPHAWHEVRSARTRGWPLAEKRGARVCWPRLATTRGARARATTSRVTEGAQPSIHRGTVGARPARSLCDRPGAWRRGDLTRSAKISEAAALATIKVVRGRACARTVVDVLAIMELRAPSHPEADQERFRCQRAGTNRRELDNKRLIPTGPLCPRRRHHET